MPQFNVAAQALGLEWLATEVAQSDADSLEEAEAIDTNDPANQPAQRLYLTMPTERALSKLLSQWKRYEKGREPPDEDHKALWKLFDYLHGLHVWSIEDRLDPTLALYVNSALADRPVSDVVIELDLWYRTEAERRDQSLQTLQEMLNEVGGELLDSVDIEEISYQGALVRVPPQVARRLVQGQGRIAEFNDVMTIRPQSAYESKIELDQDQAAQASPGEPDFERPCIAALLDGYPIERHDMLAGRVTVTEIDVAAAEAPAFSRHHGTSMASLIIHGDLESPSSAPLNRPLAVIPVLVAPSSTRRESTPAGKLPIGVIYRALNAIVTMNDGDSPEMEKVVVINHSICDDYAPFVRRPSPWSTLLDYFAHKHRLLIVISAGNIFSSFPVSAYPNLAAFAADHPDTRQAAILGAIEMAKGTRGLLTPAEAVNALTVGAVHADHAPADPAAPHDPYPTFAMSNLASATGLGANRSVKPDLLAHGGRFAAGVSNVAGGIEVHAKPTAHYGQQVASPSRTGTLNRRMRTAGTSNAAALVTRAAHFVADAVEEVFDTEGIDWTALDTRAVILKTLLVHGASWGPVGDVLHAAYPPREPKLWSARRNTITRFLGYGALDESRVIQGGHNRITLLADDKIKAAERHTYVLPVPPSMVANRDIRSCTVTLSWTCPTTHTTTDHRAVVLQLSGEDNAPSFWAGVDRSGNPQPNITTANRGTVIHIVQDGKKKMANGRIVICVQASAKEGFEQEEVPYALAVTLELAQQQRSTLYTEVEQQVRARARARQR
ncbi:S8 family serine peptidase [Roseateles sp. MS654]|uniref:S8 family serine peptidase n=1 Tax=Roseateles sp. MS654 TaxID=3412685 RepID=UPI003C2EDC2C